MNQAVPALLAAPMAWDWLATTRQARILHLFDHACNLVNEHGRVLSLVSKQIGAGPFHIVLPNPFVSFVVGDLSPTTNVVVYPDGLQVGEWHVDISKTAIWQPRVDWDGLRAHTAVWQPHIPRIHTLVQRYRAERGLDTTVWQPPIQAGLDRLLWGIRAEDTVVIQAATTQLAGLGPGLTPAGDDVLMGVMLGLWATRSAEVARPLVEMIAGTAFPELVEGAVPRTTTLSAAWLRAAGRGEAGELWHELTVRLSVNGNRWEEAVVRILGTGHSSGAEALWGFLSIVRSP